MTIEITNRYAAKAFVEEVHGLLTAAANRPMTEDEEARVLELEDESIRLLSDKKTVAKLRIIRSDGAGPSDNEKAIDYNTLSPVEKVEAQAFSRTIQWNGGPLTLEYNRYTAISEKYDYTDKDGTGRSGADSTSSSAEGFVETDSGPQPFGGASALLARLLEAHAAGLA